MLVIEIAKHIAVGGPRDGQFQDTMMPQISSGNFIFLLPTFDHKTADAAHESQLQTNDQKKSTLFPPRVYLYVL